MMKMTGVNSGMVSVLAFDSVRFAIFFVSCIVLSNASAQPDCVSTAVRATISETQPSAVR